MADPIVDPAPAAPASDQAQVDTINAAVSAHLKRHLAGLPGMIDAAIAPLREQFAAREKPADKAPAGAGTGDSDVARELATLKSQLQKERETTAAERRSARESAAFQSLRTELTGKVRPEAVDVVAKLMFHADKLVSVADDGMATVKHGDADFDLRGGVAAYLKSPGAAMFLPAPNGTSQRPGQRVPGRPPAGGPPPNETPMAKTLRLLAGVKAG